MVAPAFKKMGQGSGERSGQIAGWKASLQLEKQEQAENRNLYWRSLSPEQQLGLLNDRLGKDVGAKRQRARIIQEIINNTPTEEEK
ncbi:MAG: hypothetical protein H8D97_01610 [Proteobacteria bacterium]|nr:hypothetical protein [Pseudomonadota bacterium]